MLAARPGEVWMTDLGMAAKVRPCLILTPPPKTDELDVFTVVAHTTSLRGNRWELSIAKPFLDSEGVFDVDQQREPTLAERIADRAGNEAALRKAGQEAVLEHARAGFPVATLKDGKVVWLEPEEVLAQLAKTNGAPVAKEPGAPRDPAHPNRSDS